MKLSSDDFAILAAVNAHYPRLREILEARLDDWTETLIQGVDEATVRKAQGRAAELKDLIKLLKEAYHLKA